MTIWQARACRRPGETESPYQGGRRLAEWQQEVASQATWRNQILTANKDAVTALTAGSKALGDLLGQSWIADRLARWQDYWSAGGVGTVGDAPTVIEVHAAQGKCLDVEGGKKDNGTPVQLYTCNGSAAQKWQILIGSTGLHLMNVNSQKCMDVSNNDSANGTKIQIWTCNSSPAQTWEFNLRATTALKNTGTGKCLDLHEYTNGYNSWLYTCNGTGPQQFDVKPSDHTATVPPTAQFTKAKAGITAAQATAKSRLAALKTQLTAAQKAATASDTAEQAAYTIADSNGTPRGRGLLVGQQKAQVTKGAVAALTAMVKAGETAEAATRASAADSHVPATEAGCPKSDTVFLGTQTFKDLHKSIEYTFQETDYGDLIRIVGKVAYDVLVKDFVDCYHQVTPGSDGGSVSGCAWAAAAFVPGDKIAEALEAFRVFDKALREGASVEEAIDHLRVADRDVMEGLESAAVAKLAATEGLKITRGTLEARLVEYVRRYSLGVDPAKGLTFNQGEMHSALRVESERGVQLTRDKTGDLEWYDQAGRGYDAVGNSPSEYLQIPQFVNSIKAHLLKTEKSGRFVSFIPVDVSTYTADQIKAIKAAVKGLPEADQARIFYVGDHT